MTSRLPRIAIVGSGLAAWMAAAALANTYKGQRGTITLVETPGGGRIGEATIPTLRAFNEKLGIGEDDFIRATKATFSLGTEFRDWSADGTSFFHPFGQYGTSIENVGFHHCWQRLHTLGDKTPLSQYALASVAAALGKFARPSQNPNSVLSSYSYGFHFDPDLYAAYLRRYALERAVHQEKRSIRTVNLRAGDGYIEGLVLEGGSRLEADLYIDCTGEIGVLIEQALHTGYEDWSRWLPSDRMLVAESADEDASPFTRIAAKDFGWQWRIPLQNRISEGWVYCSGLSGDDAVHAGLPEDRPAVLHKFANGRRRKFWNGNCVALGAAAGFLEPLEGTDIHLMQSGIARLLHLLPGGTAHSAIADEYNRLTNAEYEHIRDFLILHYHADLRAGSPFWEHRSAADIPETLAFKIDLFKSRGRVTTFGGDVFFLPSWLSLFSGLNISPTRYHPFADGIDLETLKKKARDIRTVVRQAAEAMPSHTAYLSQIAEGV